MKNCVVIAFALFCLALCNVEPAYAHPAYGGWEKTSLGIRLGWNGAPNGLTYRRVFLPGHAIEAVAGYNIKYGRHADIPALRKGNSFLGISYAPHIMLVENGLGWALIADLGARLNYHHYRRFSRPQGGWKITPGLIAGVGMQLEFCDAVEVFADLHLKLFSDPSGYYAAGMESGMGMRFVLN